MLRSLPRCLLMGLLALGHDAHALEVPLHQGTTIAGQAAVRVLFSPEQDVAGAIIEALSRARRQVLVQSFSFTHAGIALALLEAHRRGVEVRIITDREQAEAMEHGQVPRLARAGMLVWLDGDHQSAHNKVVVIDAGTVSAVVITGSFNFTRAAQHKNAENTVFISGNDALIEAYVQNWQRHRAHSSPFAIH